MAGLKGERGAAMRPGAPRIRQDQAGQGQMKRKQPAPGLLCGVGVKYAVNFCLRSVEGQ